jgi:hypothetical protein
MQRSSFVVVQSIDRGSLYNCEGVEGKLDPPQIKMRECRSLQIDLQKSEKVFP